MAVWKKVKKGIASDLIDFYLSGFLTPKPEKLILILDGVGIEEFVWSAQSVNVNINIKVG